MKMFVAVLIGLAVGFPGGVLIGYNYGYFDAGPFSEVANQKLRDCLTEVDRLKAELDEKPSVQSGTTR